MGHYIKHKQNYWERKVLNQNGGFDTKLLKYEQISDNEAKKLFAKTIKEHTATLAYAIKDNSHANLNHLDDFKSEVKYVKSKTR